MTHSTTNRLKAFVIRHPLLLTLATLPRATWWSLRGLAQRPGTARLIASYVATHDVRKLQIGAGGTTLPGWLNTDVVPGPGAAYLDATRPFPLADESFDYVFSEHQIEHIELPQGRAMLRECFRVMRPGGVIRIATPSLEQMVALTGEEPNELQRHYIDTVSDTCVPNAGLRTGAVLVNNMFSNWGHKFIYDRKTLRAALEEAGFVDVNFHDVGESRDAALQGIEHHGQALGDDRLNQIETMVAEAQKPRARAS